MSLYRSKINWVVKLSMCQRSGRQKLATLQLTSENFKSTAGSRWVQRLNSEVRSLGRRKVVVDLAGDTVLVTIRLTTAVCPRRVTARFSRHAHADSFLVCS